MRGRLCREDHPLFEQYEWYRAVSTILARRYLGALFQIASQRGIVEEVYRELEGLREIINSSNALKRILFNPAEARTTKMAVWEAIISEWERRVAPLSDLTRRFLNLLLKKNRLEVLWAIVLFRDFRNIALNQEEGVLEIAGPIDDDVLEEIRESLQHYLGKKLILTLQEKPELLAGWRARMGNKLVDGSAKSLLNRLKRHLAEGAL